MLMRKTIFTLLFMVLGIFTVMGVDNDVGLLGEELSYNIVDDQGTQFEMNAVIGLEEAIMQADQEVSLILSYSEAGEADILITKIQQGIFVRDGNYDPEEIITQVANRTILRLSASAIPKDVTINSKEVLTDFEVTFGTLS